MIPLADRKCHEIPKGTPPIDAAELKSHLADLPGWEATAGGKAIAKSYKFKNFYETMSFVNAVAHIANTQDHHPDVTLSYNTCRVQYSTHTVGGISENDLICAARIERMG
jgi:4a-hydroxytetrahydrobiopterin dehydratase